MTGGRGGTPWRRNAAVAVVASMIALVAVVFGMDRPSPGVESTSTKARPTTTTSGGDLAGEPAKTLKDLGISDRGSEGCDPISASACLGPFPNDYFTEPSARTETGRVLAFDPAAMPRNLDGVGVDPSAWTRSDGFSPGSAVLIELPGLDMAGSGIAGLGSIEESLSINAPIILWDATAGARHPYWAEVDSLVEDGSPTLIVRPAVNVPAGHRIVIGIRGAMTADGPPVDTTAGFAAYRDGQQTLDAAFEARRPRMEKLFGILAEAGAQREELQLAWDYTVASVASTAGPLLAMRDDMLAQLGGAAPAFTVNEAQQYPGGDGRVFRQVDGTFEVPLYLTGSGEPGSSLVLDDRGLPIRQSAMFEAQFRCVIPPSATSGSNDGPAVPARSALSGHGLLGTIDTVRSDVVLEMSDTFNIVYCATNISGMSAEDIGNVLAALTDMSKFSTLPDRMLQGIVSFHALTRLLVLDDGFSSDPAFQVGGRSVLDQDQVFYDGNSQGAIIGGAIVATSVDIERAVLGEAGMNYSTLLDRSVDFDDYLDAVFVPSYPDREERLLLMSLIGILWDRAETNGYAQHLTDDPLPNTPDHDVLLLGAVGDHQVSEYSLRVLARTAGIPAHLPLADEGRIIDGGWGIKEIPGATTGSGFFLVDTGSPVSPAGNVPARDGRDPHEDSPSIAQMQKLKDAFMRSGGRIIPSCASDAACVFPVPG